MASNFLTDCVVRVLADNGPRPIMSLIEPLQYQSALIGRTVEVPAGFTFDGASIPQPFMSLTGWPGVRAACIHDYLLCTAMDRREVDRVFREALAVCGVEEDVAQMMYRAVCAYTASLREDAELEYEQERTRSHGGSA